MSARKAGKVLLYTFAALLGVLLLLMLGLKLAVPNTDFVAAARKHGLLIVGVGENVVRLLPPLILDEDQAREGVALLSQAAADFEGAKKTQAA